MHIEIEKPRLNPVHFIAIVVAGMVNAAGIGVVWANLNNTVDGLKQTQRELADRFDREALDRKERQKIYQTTMDGMNTQIGQIAPLQYQQSQMLEKVSENKTSIAETNKRVDRVVELFGGKLDTVLETINKLATRVEVLSSKIDDASGKTDKSMFRTPIMRP